MANPISSALGTQRQFSKQPERPYQKQLITPSFGSGIAGRTNYDAQALVGALAGFGKGLLAESIARDKRAEKIGEAEASRLFAVASEQDKEKLGTLDILGRSGKFDLADNPYAIARIDELRGQHLNTLYKNEYDLEVFPNQELPKTSQENIQRYEDFMEEKLNSYEGDVVNKTAFAKGFYGSRPVDVLNQDAKYRKQRQANLEADRNASIGTKIEGIVTNSINKPVEETVAALQDAQTDSMLSALSLTERIKIAEATGKGLAANGNPELLNAWGETVLYFNGVDEDGKAIPIKVKDRIPLGHYIDLANKYNVSMNEEKTRNFLKSIEDVPPELLADAFEKLKLNDPSLYKSIAPQYDTILKRKTTERAKRLKEEAKLVEVQLRKQSVTNVLDDKYNAIEARKPVDSYGMAVTDNKLPNGKTITDTEASIWGQEKLTQLAGQVAAGSITRVDAAKKAMSLLTMKQLSELVKSEKGNMELTLAGLTPASLIGADGVTRVPDSLDKFINMYKVDSSMFGVIFGDKATNEIATLSSLIDMNGIQEGVTKYSEYKVNKADPSWRASVNKSADNRFGDIQSGTMELKSLGADANEDANFRFSGELLRNFRLNYETNLYLGQEEADAYTNAMNRVASNYVSFKGCAIPKAFMYNIPSAFQEKHLAAFLESEYQKIIRDYGETGVGFTYVNGSLMLRRPNYIVKSWDKNTITSAFQEWWQNIPEQERVRIDDVYYTPNWDNSNYYNSNPDASTIEGAEQQLGIDINDPIGALIKSFGGSN